MTPLPKRKLSKGRRDRRRAHDALGVPALGVCGNCRQPVLPHRVCPYCGFYKGRQVVAIKDQAAPKK